MARRSARTALLLAACAALPAAVAYAPRAHRTPARRLRLRVAVEEPAAADEIVLGDAFEVKDYPLNTDEFVNAYRRWNAAKNVAVDADEARRDIQAFMVSEELMEKWRPILAAEAEEANKMGFVDYVNAATSILLPLAVGFTLLPLVRRLGENVPIINDVILPKFDEAAELARKGVKKAVELPICLEFGDC